MKTFVILLLCATLAVTGCDSSSGSSYHSSGWDLKDALEAFLIVGTVVVVVSGAAVYDAIDARHEYDHKPGLNVRAPRSVKHGKTIEVKVAAANAKAKPQLKWWNAQRAPEISIANSEATVPDSPDIATVVSTEVKKEWHITRYKVAQPGTYTLRVKAPVPGADSGSPDVFVEVTHEIVVK